MCTTAPRFSHHCNTHKYIFFWQVTKPILYVTILVHICISLARTKNEHNIIQTVTNPICHEIKRFVYQERFALPFVLNST